MNPAVEALQVCREHDLHRLRSSDARRLARGPAFEQKREARYLVRPGVGMLEQGNRRNAGEDGNVQPFKRAPGSQVTHDDPGQVSVAEGWGGEAKVRPRSPPGAQFVQV